MLDRFTLYISNLGSTGVRSSSAKLKHRTLNWILFWSTIASVVWVIFLLSISNTVAAIFPLLSAVCIPLLFFTLNRETKNFQKVLNIGIAIAFFVPAMVQIFHGGFINSGAAILWTILAPITALILKPVIEAKITFVLFLIVLFSTALVEVFMHIPFVQLPKSVIILQFIINIISVISICYFPILHFSNETLKARRIIKLQNNKIISSIEYAKYIQRASLSSEEELSASLNDDFFLFYEPKDIVGGDFYWVAIKNGRVIIICADCTGHGVPGGFLTIMGINHLNNIVKEKGITDPSMILLFLHYAIRESLKYSSESITDGMDISICSIDLENNLLEFAGARNKLYYFHDKLEVILPTKVSVGEDVADVQFEKHQITMKKGDRFYMCSDGYIDQFGGPFGKRFGSKRLQMLLSEINSLGIKEQGKIIEHTMKDWKGNEEQIDDITFMGFII